MNKHILNKAVKLQKKISEEDKIIEGINIMVDRVHELPQDQYIQITSNNLVVKVSPPQFIDFLHREKESHITTRRILRKQFEDL
jgi:hypothetical protein